MPDNFPSTQYSSARNYLCPKGCRSRGASQIVPDGSGLAPVCMSCGAALVPSGGQLTGRWEVDQCGCVPPPDGWVGPPRDTRTCKWCGGTAQDVTCLICHAGGCDGKHPYCLDCDGGSGKAYCPRCEGEGIVMMPARPVPCTECGAEGCGECGDTGEVIERQEARCPQCKGKEEIVCPGCGGSGKPAKRPPGQPPAPAAEPAAPPPAPDPLPSPGSMAAGSLDEAQRSAAAQATWLEDVTTGSEQLENDLIAGGITADHGTLSAVRRARESTAVAAQAWQQVGAGLARHAPGAAYASSGYAASTSFLRL
jgi:hypothetical protein